MVQVVLLDTEANIPSWKYSNSPETMITTTNYTPKRSVDMTPPPSANAEGGAILPRRTEFVITALKHKINDHNLKQ